MRLKKVNLGMDNKGFSIVELLIAVAIAAIVGASVFGFMSVGAKTFSFNSADVNIQNESQLAFNQIQELVIDTAVGVEYYNEDTNTPLVLDTVADDSYDKKLVLYNYDPINSDRNIIYEILWNHSDHKLYYSEYESELNASKEVVKKSSVPAIVDEALMSAYITGFSADLTRLVSNRVVRVDLSYEKGGRTLNSSHNITLRNQVVSSNKIEEHLKDAYDPHPSTFPDNIVGKEVIYVEPGETVDLNTLGYTVFDNSAPPNDITADQPLIYDFVTGSDHETGVNPTYIGSDNKLHVSPFEQAGNFAIMIYCANDHTVKFPPDLNVRVVRNEEITIDFKKGTECEDEITNAGAVSDEDKYADDLKVGETFELEAKPKISWTVAKVISMGETLDSTDETKLNTIESNIKKHIYFKGVTGYGTGEKDLFYVADGSTLGVPSPGNGNSKPKFKMSASFSFETGGTNDYYLAPISVRAICGYSEDPNNYGTSVDVHKDWDKGRAYRKKGDYTIKKNGDYFRGIERNDRLYSFSTIDKSKFPINTDHAEFLDVTVTEEPDGTIIPPSIWLKDGSGHANWHWELPTSVNPNKIINFHIVSYWGNVSRSNPKVSGGDAVYLLPHNPFTKDSQYEAMSEPLDITFDRLRLTYNDPKVSNVKVLDAHISPQEEENKESDSKYVVFYPREWGKDMSNLSGVKGQLKFKVDYNPSFYHKNPDQNGIPTRKALGNGNGWFLREFSNGNWMEYSNGEGLVKRVSDEINNWDEMFVYCNRYTDNDKEVFLTIKTDKNQWSKNIPSRLRLVPKFAGKKLDYATKAESNHDYAIEDNYVECIFWNIKVPYKPGIIQGTIGELAGDTKVHRINGNDYENCYFPAPPDPNEPNDKGELNWPGESEGDNAPKWLYAGYDKDSGYVKKGKKYYDLNYTLKKRNLKTGVQWTLILKTEDNTDIAEYKYNFDTKQWDIQ